MPGVVFANGEFRATDWLVTPVVNPGEAEFVHTEERSVSGGNPGAFRKMVYQIPAAANAMSALAIEQNGLWCVATSSIPLRVSTSWSAVANRTRMLATDFMLPGAALGPDTLLPDFSVNATPLRLGCYRSVGAGPGVSFEHGIDNRKVTLWRR